MCEILYFIFILTPSIQSDQVCSKLFSIYERTYFDRFSGFGGLFVRHSGS